MNDTAFWMTLEDCKKLFSIWESQIDNNEIGDKVEAVEETYNACPTDPFLRVMCEWCQ